MEVLHVVTGPGETVGHALVTNPDVDGITFTGSYEVGMEIYRSFTREHPKPTICEMGGKNPVIVSRHADLDVAAQGTARSAFGLSGQKCSAASRAYVERPVAPAFITKLVAQAEGLKVGDPLARDTYLGPVVDEAAVTRYERAVAEARERGTVHCGGERLTDGDLGARHVPPADGGRGTARLLDLDDGALRPAHRRGGGGLARRGVRARQHTLRSA